MSATSMYDPSLVLSGVRARSRPEAYGMHPRPRAAAASKEAADAASGLRAAIDAGILRVLRVPGARILIALGASAVLWFGIIKLAIVLI
jgi:hypothetical protein